MIKLIGWLVLAAVLVVGWDAWVKWYDGEASAKQTVQEVRQRLGELIMPEPTPAPPPQTPPAAPKAPVRDAPAESSPTSVWRVWLRQLLE
jgi:hypothetical protein